MTMHLCGPALTMTGKKRGKQKFRSAAEAQRARELASEWSALKQKWGAPEKSAKRKSNVAVTLPTQGTPYKRITQDRPESLNSWHQGAVSTKPNQQYTGTNILGIGTLHKSNAVPIFSDQEAVDIAKMRR